MIQDRAIITMTRQYELVCDLSSGAISKDLDSWVTFSNSDLAKYSMTRNIARPLCDLWDSWASCRGEWNIECFLQCSRPAATLASSAGNVRVSSSETSKRRESERSPTTSHQQQGKTLVSICQSTIQTVALQTAWRLYAISNTGNTRRTWRFSAAALSFQHSPPYDLTASD